MRNQCCRERFAVCVHAKHLLQKHHFLFNHRVFLNFFRNILFLQQMFLERVNGETLLRKYFTQCFRNSVYSFAGAFMFTFSHHVSSFPQDFSFERSLSVYFVTRALLSPTKTRLSFNFHQSETNTGNRIYFTRASFPRFTPVAFMASSFDWFATFCCCCFVLVVVVIVTTWLYRKRFLFLELSFEYESL